MYATNLKVQLQFYALSFRSCIIEFNEVQIFKIKMMWRESCTLPDQEKSTQYILLRQYLNLNEQKSFHYFIIFRASFTDFTRRLVMISVTGWNFLSMENFCTEKYLDKSKCLIRLIGCLAFISCVWRCWLQL